MKPNPVTQSFVCDNPDVPFEVKLAYRYFISKSGGLTRLTAISAVMGIALGVGCLIFVQAVYSGFNNGIEQSLLKHQPHLIIGMSDGAAVGQPVISTVSNHANVARIEPMAVQNAIVRHLERAEYSLLSVRTDPDTHGGVRIGSVLAKKLGVRAGNDIEILIPGGATDYESATVKIEAIAESGLYDLDSIFLSLPESALSRKGAVGPMRANAYYIKLRDPFEARKTAIELNGSLGGDYEIRDWQSTNKPLFSAMQLERRIAFIVFALLILVSAFGLTSTLSLLVAERRLDFALLKTCGLHRAGIIRMMMIEGGALGVCGIAVGIVLGITACAAGNYLGLTKLSPEIYSISEIFLRASPTSMFVISASAFALTLAATLLPAFRSANSRPMDLLRNL